VVAAVAVGFLLSERLGPPLAQALLGPLLADTALDADLQAKWIQLLALVIGLVATIPMAVWAARAARFETLLGGLRSYFSQTGAGAFLAFIVFYKLGDAFAGSLMTPFLLKSMLFTQAEVGVVNKVIGLWLTIAGALLGGALMLAI
jgi:PAT family beta-lactamase induction signal transducer AmpG